MRRAFAAALTAAIVVALITIPASAARAPHQGMGTAQRTRLTAMATRLGPLPPGTAVEIALVLRGQHEGELGALLAALNDPRSPRYHQYLTPAQFAARFGPDSAAVGSITARLGAAGLRVDAADSSGALLAARGPASAVEALLGVRLDRYRGGDGAVYYAPSAAPRVDAALAPYVSGVLGLDSRARVRARPLLAGRAGQGVDAGGLGPSDLARAYDLGPLQAKGLDGTNQTIAL